MNKNELIRETANNAGITIKEATTAFDAVVKAITDGLKNGEKIQISGFGTFEVKEKPERDGLNPKTGEKIKISASKLPAFKLGKAFKDELNA